MRAAEFLPDVHRALERRGEPAYRLEQRLRAARREGSPGTYRRLALFLSL